MAKTKQTPSAANRREQQRKQRQQQLGGSRSNQYQSRNRVRKQQQRTNRSSFFLVGGVIVVLVVIVGIFVYLSHQSTGNGSTATDPSVFKKVTQVDPNVLASIGTEGVQNPLQTIKQPPPPLVGSTGKPEFFYAGGEYCPYCASERWSMVVALSRFGTFGQLSQITSAESSISTFTFYHVTYTSQYIDFVPVELSGNTQDATGNYVTLQVPTAQQNQLITTYDAPPYISAANAGSIPFIDIGNKYIQIGIAPGFSPQDLQNMQWSDIANGLSDTNSTATQHILGAANYLTAGICMITHQQPGSVCNGSEIQKIEQSLGKTAFSGNGTQFGTISSPTDAVVRRID